MTTYERIGDDQVQFDISREAKLQLNLTISHREKEMDKEMDTV